MRSVIVTGMVSHTFNSSKSGDPLLTHEAESGDLCEFKATLVYIVSSSTARATQRGTGGRVPDNCCYSTVQFSKPNSRKL